MSRALTVACFSFSQIHFQNSQPFADLLTVRGGNLQLIVLQRVRRRLREAAVKHERPSKLCSLTAVLAPLISRLVHAFARSAQVRA